MDEIIKQLIEFLRHNLGTETIGLLLLCFCTVYIWYLHNKNKLLKERIEFEKEKKDDFLKAMQNLQKVNKDRKFTPSLGGKRHILVVDDETGMLDLIRELLEDVKPSIEIDTAEDGKAALAKIIEKKPSILISDIAMPRMSGIDLIKELQNRGLQIPTLLYSGYFSAEKLEKIGLQFGENLLFLSKPFDIDEFLSLIEKLKGKDTDSNNGNSPERCRAR
jgi:CheY-like chemotaxis protein